MTEPSAPVVRPAVTLMLVRRDPLRVLMAQRGTVGAFAGALAFPGGVVDPEDADEAWLEVVDGADELPVEERARRVAAVRELHEETGIVLGSGSVTAPGGALLDVLRASGRRVDVSVLHGVSRWITP